MNKRARVCHGITHHRVVKADTSSEVDMKDEVDMEDFKDKVVDEER